MTDNKQTDAKVPVTIMETAANIKDYYNLRTCGRAGRPQTGLM